MRFPALKSLSYELRPTDIEERLLKRPTLGEVAAIFLATIILVYITLIIPYKPDPVDGSGAGFDWRVFQAAARDETPYFDFYYFNPYWLLPIIYVIQLVGDPLGYFIWNILNFAGVLFAGRVFGGRIPPMVLSFQMIWIIMTGQITGILLAGLAMLWWSLNRERWHIAGLAMLLSIGKYHWGIPLTLAVWLLTDISWRDRFKVLVVPTIVAALSLIVYPLWIIDVINDFQKAPPEASASISLWQWIFVGALVLWIPVLLLSMKNDRRLIAIAATVPLAMPYFQQTDLVVLYAFPVGWIGWLGHFGWVLLAIDIDFSSLRWLFFIPLIVYIQIMWQPVKRYFEKPEDILH